MKKLFPLKPILWWELLLLLIGSSPLQAVWGQETCFSVPISVIDSISLPPGFSQIEVDIQGNIYALSPSRKEIRKYLAGYAYDSVLLLGGSSSRLWEGLLEPVEMLVNNYQQLYLLDTDSNQLLVYDKDFSRLNQLSFQALGNVENGFQLQDFQALSMTVNTLSEIYLLNQWDNRIYQFTPQGSFIQAFGGNDYGAGSLNSPKKLTINAKNDIFVQDHNPESIVIFDTFGTYRSHIRLPFFSANTLFTLLGEYLAFWEATQLHLGVLLPHPSITCIQEFPFEIQDLCYANSNLYILSHKRIIIIPFTLK